MTIKTETLEPGERIINALRQLYQSYGYKQYKVSKFEEYDLYMENKKFLMSEQVLTFSDMNGKLMALKPDITLSIIKNTRDEDRIRKLCYNETVYRVPRNAYGFCEIMQTGLECIGQIDAYAAAEVLMLAARSLQEISRDYVLDVSDMGVISALLAEAELPEEAQRRILDAVGEKNQHGLGPVCAQYGVPENIETLLKTLISTYGPLDETLAKMEKLSLPAGCAEALAGLGEISGLLKLYGLENINLDFSVVNDMDYYNGLVFRGFIKGIPVGVLSGGRYDNLMIKMGKHSQAIGFAVYLDELERFMDTERKYDVDTLIIYDPEGDLTKAAAMAEELRAGGKTVRVQPENTEDLSAREVIYVNGR